MNNSSNQPPKNVELLPETVLTPIAVLRSGESIISIVARVILDGVSYTTLLSGPALEPSGFSTDETALLLSIGARGFRCIDPAALAPTFMFDTRHKGIEALVHWLAANPKSLIPC